MLTVAMESFTGTPEDGQGLQKSQAGLPAGLPEPWEKRTGSPEALPRPCASFTGSWGSFSKAPGSLTGAWRISHDPGRLSDTVRKLARIPEKLTPIQSKSTYTSGKPVGIFGERIEMDEGLFGRFGKSDERFRRADGERRRFGRQSGIGAE